MTNSIYIYIFASTTSSSPGRLADISYRGRRRSDNENFNNPLPSFLSFSAINLYRLDEHGWTKGWMDGWIVNDPSKESSKGDRSIWSKSEDEIHVPLDILV